MIVLVRHGERLDEVDRFAWSKMRTHENQYDPPLTKTGARERCGKDPGKAEDGKVDGPRQSWILEC